MRKLKDESPETAKSLRKTYPGYFTDMILKATSPDEVTMQIRNFRLAYGRKAELYLRQKLKEITGRKW